MVGFFVGFCGRFLRNHWTFALGLRSWLRAWFAHGLCPRNVGIHWLQCWTALSWMGYWWVSFRPQDFRFSGYFSSFFQSRLSQFWIKILLHGGHGAGSACYPCWLWWSRAALHRVATTLTASYAARAPTLRSHRFSLTGLESQLKAAAKNTARNGSKKL